MWNCLNDNVSEIEHIDISQIISKKLFAIGEEIGRIKNFGQW